MKNFSIVMFFVFSLTAFGSIEYVESEQSKATPAEISRNRSCFKELASEGCRDPGEDTQQFRTCMSEVYPRLTKNCQTLMSKLYGK